MAVDGETIFIGIIRDISVRLAAEKAKSEFIATISHELRTPLTAVSGALKMLQAGALDNYPKKRSGVVGLAVRDCDQLQDLINSILDFERIEAGQMKLKLAPIDLRDLAEEATRTYRRLADQYSVRFEFGPDAESVMVMGDRDRLMQVMANLLSNAAKFFEPDSTVEICVDRDDDQGEVRVRVQDQGCGIPEAAKDKVFERCTQLDSSDQRHKGGTGLGLSIARELIELHGDHIGFTSKEGVGTTFHFTLEGVHLKGAEA